MKTVENISLALKYGVDDGMKSVTKTTTYNNVSTQASEVKMKEVGDAIFTLMDVSNKNVLRKETASLG